MRADDGGGVGMTELTQALFHDVIKPELESIMREGDLTSDAYSQIQRAIYRVLELAQGQCGDRREFVELPLPLRRLLMELMADKLYPYYQDGGEWQVWA